MINIKANYNKEKDIVNYNYASEHSCTWEHMVVIKDLLLKIIENDPTMESIDDIIKIIKSAYIEEIKEKKKNGKRNSKPKTEV